jgi:two-component system, OmpR family, response regulator
VTRTTSVSAGCASAERRNPHPDGSVEPVATLITVLTVALCEDDAALRGILVRALSTAGHFVVVAHDGREALARFPDASPDVVILDIGLPDSDGRDVCMALRAAGLGAPVLMLTARERLHDKVAGFESGADDYLTKPFELAELIVRLNALARRQQSYRASDDRGLSLDPSQHAFTTGDATVALTPTEYRLLARLVGRPGDVVRRHELTSAGWPMGAVVNDNTLDSYIRRLRTKLEEASHESNAIETVRGVGYVWR